MTQPLVGLLLCCGAASAQQDAALTLHWADTNHPSGIYHATEGGTLAVTVDNATAAPERLQGSVAFGMRTGTGDFKPLSVTPVTATTVAAGERVRIPLAVKFAGAGMYELRWTTGGHAGEPIPNADGLSLECIFAPRVGAKGDERWLATLPRAAAVVPGYLADLAAQTGVRNYLIDERFAFDAATGVALGVGASLGASSREVDALFAEAQAAQVGFVLRVAVPSRAADPRAVDAFHRYMADAVQRAHGTLRAIVIEPEESPADGAAYRAWYLAGYSAAKAGDAKVLMLGAGSAEATRNLLLKEGLGLSRYVDGVAVTDVSGQPALAEGEGGISKLPVWVLPPRIPEGWRAVPAAVGLAEGAAVVTVPPPGVDRGVVEHLLGGAAVYQKLHSEPGALPYVVSFQGDRYAVAAVAGLGAGTPADAAWPGLARSRTVVVPAAADGKPASANLEIGDDTGTIRVVDAAGAPVECRDGDTLYVPAGNQVVYVLQGGNAEDLMGVLRSARPNRMPMMDMAATRRADGVTVRLTNMTAAAAAGTVRIIAADKTLGEQAFSAVAAGKTVEVAVDLSEALPKDGTVIVEVALPEAVQRTALHVGT